MTIPAAGRSHDEVLEELRSLRDGDVDHARGRAFGLVFHADDEIDAAVQAAHEIYVWANGLNPAVFPGLQMMSSDVVASAASLFGGDEVDSKLAGFLTSGGTESILCAVKAAKVRWLERGGEGTPNMVMPMSAHAAFDKGCEYFGLEPRRLAVRDDYRADVDAMAAAVDGQTALLVGSAPQYPQGVIDPIAELGEVAVEHDLHFHVDACMGGFTLPFLAMEGLVDTRWDFRVPGVTTISADIHKYGYTPKGASVILHRDEASRRRQSFVFDGWLGGLYASSGLLGTKPGGPIAAAWASLQVNGVEGFRRLARAAYDVRAGLEAGVRAIPGLTVLGNRRSRSAPSAPAKAARSMCSLLPTRSGGAAGTSTGRLRPTASTPRARPCRPALSSTSSWRTWLMSSPSWGAAAPTTAPPATPRSE